MFRRRREWYNEVVVYEKRTNTQGNTTRMDPADAPVQEND